MSRIGKQTITIPEKVKVSFEDGVFTVAGPRGEINRKMRDEIKVLLKDNILNFELVTDSTFAKSLWGTYASHARNMIKGVTEGHKRALKIEGVGYKSEVQGEVLVLNVGYSHSVPKKIPKGLTVTAVKNEITIEGADIEEVNAFAADVRKVRKPEPYKGKGIRYSDEVVRRKQGKRAST